LRKILIATAALIALINSALAADLPNVKGPPVFTPPPAFSWTGFYVGANAGAAWGDFDNSYMVPGSPSPPNFLPADAAALSTNGSNTFRPVGFTGGAQVGYNYQINALVLGVETDFDYLGLRKATSGTFTTPFAGPVTSSTSVSTSWLYTLRPRIGVTVGPALLYATGGLAVAEEHVSEANIFDPAFANAGSDIFSASQARVGWVVGGGAEYRIDDHWSVKGEYLYARFQALDGVSTSSSPYFAVTTPIYFGHHVSLNTQLARVGFEYNFDWMAPPTPVVAKY
jgi:outer membrane immunogenic protein